MLSSSTDIHLWNLIVSHCSSVAKSSFNRPINLILTSHLDTISFPTNHVTLQLTCREICQGRPMPFTVSLTLSLDLAIRYNGPARLNCLNWPTAEVVKWLAPTHLIHYHKHHCVLFFHTVHPKLSCTKAYHLVPLKWTVERINLIREELGYYRLYVWPLTKYLSHTSQMSFELLRLRSSTV